MTLLDGSPRGRVLRGLAFVAVVAASLLFGMGLVFVLADAMSEDSPDVAPIALVTTSTTTTTTTAPTTIPDSAGTPETTTPTTTTTIATVAPPEALTNCVVTRLTAPKSIKQSL